MRKSFLSFAPLAGLVVASTSMLGCTPDTDTLACGEGTEQVGHDCLPKNRDAGVDAQPGAAPSFGGVTSVAPASGSALQVTWDAASDGISKQDKLIYNVYVSTAPSSQNFHAPTATTPPGVTHINVNSLAPADSTWYVVVRAVNEAGQEDTNTVEKSAKATADSTAPTFGGITAAEADPTGGVKLSWDPATDEGSAKEAITYLIYFGEVDGSGVFGSPLIITEPGASSAVVKALPKPGVDYFFGVRARDAAGNLELNKITKGSKAGPDKTPPTFSGCSGAAAKDAGSITVTWKPATDDTTPSDQITYEIFAGTASGKEDLSKPAGTMVGGTTTLVTGLNSKTTYYLWCRAKDLSGNSETNKLEVFATTADDSVAPEFGGVTGSKDAGPTGITLTYTAATDDKSAPADIKYLAFQSKVSADDAVSKPSVASVTGLTELPITGLDTGTAYFFVVRAEDSAKNRETNVKSINTTTLISFKANIQPILNANCAVSGCHVLPTPPAGMVLSSGFAYSNTVGVLSVQNPPMDRIHKLDPENSYLYRKITGRPAPGFNAMPPPGATSFPTTEEKDRIKAWITQGALDN